MSLAPDFLTVEEAAAVLRIGRTPAYELARRFEATNGEEGLPCERFGKSLRIPRYAIEAILGGPITWPPERHAKAHDDHEMPTINGRRQTRRDQKSGDQQAALPFPASA
jgi:Helix-turn-helix domain